MLFVRCKGKECPVCSSMPPERAVNFLKIVRKSPHGFFTPTPVGTPDEEAPSDSQAATEAESDTDSEHSSNSVKFHSQVAAENDMSEEEPETCDSQTCTYETFLQAMQRQRKHAPKPDMFRPSNAQDVKCSVCGLLCFSKGDLKRHRTMFHPSKRGRKPKDTTEDTTQKCTAKKRPCVTFETGSNEARLNAFTIRILIHIAETHSISVPKYGPKNTVVKQLAEEFSRISETVETKEQELNEKKEKCVKCHKVAPVVDEGAKKRTRSPAKTGCASAEEAEHPHKNLL